MITLERRSFVPMWLRYATPLLAIGVTVILGGIIFAVLGLGKMVFSLVQKGCVENAKTNLLDHTNNEKKNN